MKALISRQKWAKTRVRQVRTFKTLKKTSASRKDEKGREASEGKRQVKELDRTERKWEGGEVEGFTNQGRHCSHLLMNCDF